MAMRASENEPLIRELLHHFTSWSAGQDPTSASQCDPVVDGRHSIPEAYPVTRILTQALANIVTSNRTLTTKLWSLYTSLPEDQLVLMYVRFRCDVPPKFLSSDGVETSTDDCLHRLINAQFSPSPC
jgi:hypothetical protein